MKLENGLGIAATSLVGIVGGHGAEAGNTAEKAFSGNDKDRINVFQDNQKGVISAKTNTTAFYGGGEDELIPQLEGHTDPEILNLGIMTTREAIKKANDLKANILSLKEVDERINNGPQLELNPLLTGTMVIYGNPDKPLGDTIQFDGMTVAVPFDWRGMENVAIVCEHPGFVIGDDGKIEFNDNAKIVQFPRKDGWYMTDEYGIPNGAWSGADNPNARYLLRDEGGHIGLITMADQPFNPDNRRVVGANTGIDYRLGVLVGETQVAVENAPNFTDPSSVTADAIPNQEIDQGGDEGVKELTPEQKAQVEQKFQSDLQQLTLNSKNVTETIKSIYRLGNSGDERAKKPLINKLEEIIRNNDSSNDEVASIVVFALTKLKANEALKLFLDITKNEKFSGEVLERVREAIVYDLLEDRGEIQLTGEELAEQEFQFNLERLKINPGVYAVGLGDYGDRRAIKPLMSIFNIFLSNYTHGDPDSYDTYITAVDALVKLKATEIVPLILKALEKRGTTSNKAATISNALVSLKNNMSPVEYKQTFSQLLKILELPLSAEIAAYTLGNFGDKKAIKPLLKILKKTPKDSADTDNQGIINRSLAQLGDEESLDFAVKQLEDPNLNLTYSNFLSNNIKDIEAITRLIPKLLKESEKIIVGSSNPQSYALLSLAGLGERLGKVEDKALTEALNTAFDSAIIKLNDPTEGIRYFASQMILKIYHPFDQNASDSFLRAIDKYPDDKDLKNFYSEYQNKKTEQ